MDKIIALLTANPQGLTLDVIARETKCLFEITRKRLELYIDELKWAGVVVELRDGRIRLRK